MSQGLADLTDPRVIQQIVHGHPTTRKEHLSGKLPAGLSSRKVSINLRKRYSHLKSLAGTGPSDFRNEYLRSLTLCFHDTKAKQAVKQHEEFSASFLNDELNHMVQISLRTLLLTDVRERPYGSKKRSVRMSKKTSVRRKM